MSHVNYGTYISTRIPCPFSSAKDGRHTVKVYLKYRRSTHRVIHSSNPALDHVDTECGQAHPLGYLAFNQGCGKLVQEIFSYVRSESSVFSTLLDPQFEGVLHRLRASTRYTSDAPTDLAVFKKNAVNKLNARKARLFTAILCDSSQYVQCLSEPSFITDDGFCVACRRPINKNKWKYDHVLLRTHKRNVEKINNRVQQAKATTNFAGPMNQFNNKLTQLSKETVNSISRSKFKRMLLRVTKDRGVYVGNEDSSFSQIYDRIQNSTILNGLVTPELTAVLTRCAKEVAKEAKEQK